MAKKLRDWQQEIDAQAVPDSDTANAFLHFSEELGRLARAIRHQRGLYAETPKTAPTSLEAALGRTMHTLIVLANRTDTDLEAAFRKKDSINAGRNWKSQP